MNKNNKSFYLYFVIIIGLLLFTVWLGTLSVPGDTYTKGELEAQLKNENVAMVNIKPNKETPTGSVKITLKSGEERVLYVTDVREIEEFVRGYGIDPSIESIPKENWFLNSVFPILLVTTVCVFFFVMFNSQNSSGGSGGKMMNFGKSRARLSLGGDNRITLE